jgi:hypothetical protein
VKVRSSWPWNASGSRSSPTSSRSSRRGGGARRLGPVQSAARKAQAGAIGFAHAKQPVTVPDGE